MKNLGVKISIPIFSLILLGSANVVFAAGNVFTLTYGDQKFPVSQDQLTEWQGLQSITSERIFPVRPESLKLSLLKFLGQTTSPKITTQTYHYQLSEIYNYIEQLGTNINVPTIEPVMEMQDGVVTKFTPPQTGTQLDAYKSSLDVLVALETGTATSSELSANKSEPQTSLSQTNNLGINELIAEGTSSFKGSPNNRRHNIAVGVTKFQGVLVKPGEEFSFNKNLGPVEAEEGFLPELVIKGDKGTVPELGGGLCQVSSTAFRAAMAAGLPITQRRNHAYAVQYYSPQGTDATIYPGVIDLKFINDTPADILIYAFEKDKNTLIFDFYGTKDSRKVTLEKPVVYDRQTDGSMKATWTREVIKADGTPRTDIFKSTYQSPALFHKTEQFVSASSSPTSGLQVPKTN
ncbi:MAG TPA: VanW family protein [Candidatus Limnocylindria bacterium]|nr:VanW family protein [Candidatus Limnocylindria bacterium]